MINWVIGLFVAAILAAALGFGGATTALAGTAQVIFFILLILFVVSAVVAMVGTRAPAVHATVRSVSLVVLIAAVSIGAYAWIENGMSAEKLGRTVDRQTVSIVNDASLTVHAASDRTQAFVSRTIEDLRPDAKTASNEDAATSENTSRE